MLESFGPEHDAMPRLSLHSALGTALLLTSPLAMALGFGPTRNLTTLGQPLNFAATVVVDADETVSRDCVKAEVFAGDNPVAARHVRAVLEVTRDPGQRIVRVTTSIAIDEPVVTLEVSIGCGSRISRRFVAFIDPPAMHLAETVAPSETVPLPSSRIDSQVAALADVARQADASRRRAESNARGDDSERPPRAPRRAPRTPAPVVVASATPVADTKPRKPPTAARRNESKTRTALAAAPRTGGARLQLDPPRMLAALRLTPTPTAPAAVPTTIAPANPAAAAGPASAPLMLAHAETDPLLAQIAAAAAAAAGASTPALTPAQERVQLLEAEVARMRGESQATQQTVAALQARVRQAEEARFRNVLVYILAATTLLGLLAAALLWWLRPRQRSRARWFDAQARQQALAAARAGPSTSAGLASQPAPLSRPLGLTPSPARPAPPPAPLRSGQPSGWNSGTSSLMPTTQHSAIGGLEVTTVLGPELSRPSVETFGGGGASLRAGSELTMEELIDLEQQAEFFVVLGQDEAAMTLLESYIDGHGKSPLPYLQLLEIHQRRDDRRAFDDLRHVFNERFNANAPDWSLNLHRGRSLEDYPQTVALVQSLWSTPLSAMQALDGLLFRRQTGEETFDFPAYRELLVLYSIAREISENVETDSGSIDLFLPLEDAPPVVAAHSQYGPLEVDLDVSQWPEDAVMSDLLSRPTPSGRRGAA
jgi:pilus assembly protein FimV